MLSAACIAGSGLLRLLRITLPTVESAFGGVAVGLGMQATLLLGLAATGWMHPGLLWAAVVAPALLGCIGTRPRRRAAVRELAACLADAGSIERVGLLSVFGIVATVALVGALGPVQDWDSLMYHVQLPRLFLEAGRLHVPPDGLHVAYLGSVQFLYLPLLAAGASAGPAVLNAALLLGLGLLVVVAGERLLSRGSGILAGIILWGSSALLLVGVTPRIDVTLIYYLLLTHLAVLRAWRDEDTEGALRYAGLLAGVAVGIKYHALPYLVAIAPFAVWVAYRDPARRAKRARALVGGGGIALLVALPWLVKNAVFFGAPLYPFFATRVVPPFIAAIQGSTVHPANVTTEIYGALGRAREAISLSGLLFHPARLTVEGEAAAFTRNWFLWLAPFGLLLWRRARGIVPVLLIPALAYQAIALGAFSRTNLRYLLPVIPAMALVAAEVVAAVESRLRAGRWWRRGAVVAALALCLPSFQSVGARIFSTLRVRIALGLEPPETLLERDPNYVLARWFSEQTPPDSRLLMLFDARGLYYRRETIQDNVLTNWPLLVGTGATDRCLEGTGITHVLFNRGVLGYYASRGLDPHSLDVDRFDPFAQRCLQRMASTRGVEIYRVR